MKPLDPEALRRLLGFYLDCLEAEDRHGLRIRRAALHHSAVSPWESEPLFHPEAAEVPLSSLKDEERRLLRGVRGLGVPQRFLYGYPMFLDGRGYLLPLFVSVVEVEELPNGRLVMRPSEAGRVLLNHHIFADRGMSREETLLLRETLEGGGGSFTDRLRAVFEALDERFRGFPVSPLDAWPGPELQGPLWINRPVLFISERDTYTRQLKDELRLLEESLSERKAVEGTVLGVLAGMAAHTVEGEAVPLLQVLPLNRAQEEAARAALSADWARASRRLWWTSLPVVPWPGGRCFSRARTTVRSMWSGSASRTSSARTTTGCSASAAHPT